MLLLNNNFNTNAYFNLALEEYFLTKKKENFFILWQNSPAVIVGLHQNTNSEINSKFIEENGIKVVRRMTGGGAVYHDLGNVNFTFIENYTSKTTDFEKYTAIIIDVLNKLGVEAKFSGRNDIVVDGRKISGNSELILNERILHHGTLLFNSNLEDVVNALNVNSVKFIGKSVQSIRSRVANISEYLAVQIGVSDFINKIFEEVKNIKFDDAEDYQISEHDLEQISLLAKEKYSTWEWNYGNSPIYNFEKKTKTIAGNIEIYMTVTSGIIKNIKIFGDFFSTGDIQEVEKLLVGIRHNMHDIKTVLSKIQIEKYFVNLKTEEFLACLI